MPNWPPALPPYLPLNVDYKPREHRVFTENLEGPSKVRLTLTGRVIDISGISMTMLGWQWDILDFFTETTLKGGSLQFDWTDPWPNYGLKTFRFAENGKPGYRVILGGAKRIVTVSFALEELPS